MKRVANCITLARMLMVPFFMYLFSIGRVFWAFILFALATISDLLDGTVARREGPTRFGRFTDPLADKLIVCAALISLTRADGGLIPGWMVMTIIAREFLVTGLRVVLAANGRIIASTKLGKAKTVSQMCIISLSLLLLSLHDNMDKLGISWGFLKGMRGRHGPIYFMMYLPLSLTVISGLEFLYNNRIALWRIFSAEGNKEEGEEW